MGYTTAPGGGGSGAGTPPGRYLASISGADAFVIYVEGSAGGTVRGVWIANESASTIAPDDVDGLVFNAETRQADSTIVGLDYATTAAAGGELHGLGTVEIYGVAVYTFETPLTVPANGLVTITVETFGAGRTLERVTIGVIRGP